MQRFAFRLLVAVITCALGIITATTRSGFGNATASDQRCRKGLVVVEEQPDAPVHVRVLETTCPVNPSFANVHYQVEGRTTRLIKRYEVRNIESYNGIEESHGALIGTKEGEGFTAADLENDFAFTGVRLDRGIFRAPIDEVRLCVWSVTFADGTTWNRALGPHALEPH